MKKALVSVLSLILALCMFGSSMSAFADGWDTDPVCIDHTYKRTVIKKATDSVDGYTAMACSACGDIQKGTEQRIAHIAGVSISKTAYAYDGNEKKPAVTAKDADGNVIAASNYTVKYYNNVKVKQNTYALITFSGKYDVAYKRSFTISLAKPVVKVTTGTNAVKLSWAKVPGAKYYRVYVYSASKHQRVANTSALSYTIKNLKAGTKYVYLVRAYFVNAAKKEVMSPYTLSDNVTALTLCKAPSVKAGVSGKTVTLKWGAVAGAKYYRIYRYNTKTKKYTSLANNVKTLSYALKNQPKGTNYYLVRAYNSAGGGSAYNTKILAKAVVKK